MDWLPVEIVSGQAMAEALEMLRRNGGQVMVPVQWVDLSEVLRKDKDALG